MEILLKSPQETEKAAGALAKEIIKKHSRLKRGIVIGLEGELGAGKTTFVKGFARGLGIKAKISSPTFVIMKSYRLYVTSYKTLFHIDAYRLKDHNDLVRLGIEEIFNNTENITLIEWSDRVKKILPKNYIKIHIDHIDEKTRKIAVQTFASTSFLRRTIRRRTAKEAPASVF